MKEQFEFFYGGPFSQWYSSEFELDGVIYYTAEQYMMAMKADYFGDTKIKEKIMATKNPSEQKALGRQVSKFDREAWDAVSRGYVYKANLAKFSAPDLKDYLLNTGDKELVEASPYDCIWGIGLAENNPNRFDKAKWRGTNWLGEVLMQVRETLRNQASGYFKIVLSCNSCKKEISGNSTKGIAVIAKGLGASFELMSMAQTPLCDNCLTGLDGATLTLRVK